MTEKDLEKLGFSQNLGKIYTTLLRLGASRAALVLKETKLQRSVVYAGLEELTKRGLISKTEVKGVAQFSPNDPKTLIDEAEEKKHLAEKVAENLKKFQSVSYREARLYEGIDIIEQVADKSLGVENGETVYFLGPSKFGIQSNLESYWKKYHKERIKKGIKCKILYDKNTEAEVVEERNKLAGCEAKYMPFGINQPMWMLIFEDHVGMVMPGDEPPIDFVIKSKQTADGFKNYFNYLWEQAK
jgi:sugar-specific transcriptional regulator TrmB